ncbi:unnamed protein product [[Candida] boidinii]|nr:unnamed protein product [[Candida] boidinii]
MNSEEFIIHKAASSITPIRSKLPQENGILIEKTKLSCDSRPTASGAEDDKVDSVIEDKTVAMPPPLEKVSEIVGASGFPSVPVRWPAALVG